jgi:hypothetical protein
MFVRLRMPRVYIRAVAVRIGEIRARLHGQARAYNQERNGTPEI